MRRLLCAVALAFALLLLTGCQPVRYGYIVSDAAGRFYYVRPIDTEPSRGWLAVEQSCYRSQHDWVTVDNWLDGEW